jgi:serine/threonine-protein kinase
MEAYVKGQTPVLPVGTGSSMPVPGDVIADKYRIEAVIGRGGMSVVYRATHLQLDQQVAIKVLSAEALLLPEYIVRLKREARAVSRIRSEHVVRVHDIGELPNGGVPYLVMECLSGLDLAAVLTRRGPFPVLLAVECILQACEALAEAHALGIVHRDLKPANLFLTESVDGSPCVKLLDFGISRMARRHGLSSLTDPGTVLGTPSYMAPEQMEAADTVDARSDIWALGTILYELLVGKPPYTGESLPQIFMKIMRSKTPKPSAVRKDVPSGIDSIVARCLKIESEDRFQSVAELAWALSSMGASNARDSAARISRVFEKHVAAEATPSGTLRSTMPPPVVNELAQSRRSRRSARHVTAAFATAAVLGAASVFGVLAMRGAASANAASANAASANAAKPSHLSASTHPGEVTLVSPEAAEGAAVQISPVLRPRDGAPALGFAGGTPAALHVAPAAVQPLRAGQLSAPALARGASATENAATSVTRAAIVAVSVPAAYPVPPPSALEPKEGTDAGLAAATDAVAAAPAEPARDVPEPPPADTD